MFETRFNVTPTFLWILPPACSSMSAVSIFQSLTLLGSLAPWKRLPARNQAPTSIGGSTSGRVAGIASVAVGGLASTTGGGAGGGEGGGVGAASMGGAAGGAAAGAS